MPTTRGACISQHPVILSGVVVPEADDNAVEGPRDRLQYQRRVREFFIPLIMRSQKPSTLP
jgi:hypothetical protein